LQLILRDHTQLVELAAKFIITNLSDDVQGGETWGLCQNELEKSFELQ